MAALMGAGAFAVHQLRYALSYGREVGGHGYLVPVGAVVVGVLLFAFAVALGRIARRAHETAPRLRRLWAGTTVSLIIVYCVQESIEGLVTGSVPGMFEHHGWVAVPLAAAVGLVIALIMRGAAAATRLPGRGAAAHAPGPIFPLEIVPPPWAPRSTRAPSRHLAARGPPAVA
jgi:hypothetical protein